MRLSPRVALAVCGLLGSVRAAEPAAEEPAVALPPFLVEETGKGPPWRYAGLPGYEVLSRCADSTTRTLTQSYVQLHRLLAVVLPPELQLAFTVPRAVILYDEELRPSAAREVVAQMVRREEAKAPPLDEPPAYPGRGFRGLAPSRRVTFLPNLRLTDSDAMIVFTLVRQDTLDTDNLYLTEDYVTYLLKNRVPALPAWFVTGFLALYQDMTFHRGVLTLKPLDWLGDEAAAAAKKEVVIAPPPVPLREFFAADLVRRDPGNAQLVKRWTAQAALFLRWGLDEKSPARHAALARFVARASREVLTESLFAQCFGLDYAAAQQQLALFLPVATRRTMRYELAGDDARPPEVTLRDAAPADLARLKGDLERLEIGYVRMNFPDAAPKYLEQARRTLLRAYERDERDPRLLAVMGLCEVDAGDDTHAREYLEAAAAHEGELRPRAWLELARLRLADAKAHPAGPDGRLSVNQTAAVLTPLFAARKQQPPLPETYELIADVWAHSAFPATRAHLGVLDEGVGLFPRRLELIYPTAELNVRRGFFTDAEPLVDLGLRLATDDATRARFAALKAQLPAAGP